jgi:ribonucleoside-diphosphate reductase beta chain
MLTFEDDFVTPGAPRPMPESADAVGAQTSLSVYGGILSREPVHDLDAEAQALSNGFHRVRAEDKRVINAQSDVNQLVPFKYKWAWDKYLSACANHWMPQEINMQRVIVLW